MRLSGTVFSKVLEMDTGITIVTPNDLKKDGEYKVAYLLHGVCGNNRTWLDYSMLPSYAAAGSTIYVMPEVGRSFYADMKYGFRYFTYITEELPEICRNQFHISAARENTVVMGGSMGGYGALKCALSKPEQYGACGAFSSCCLFLKDGLEELRASGMRREYTDNFGVQLTADFLSIFGDSMEWRPECDILELTRRAIGKSGYGKEEGRKVQSGEIRPNGQAVPSPDGMPKIYLTCGTQDNFYQDHLKFSGELRKLGVRFEFEKWDAAHDFEYFNEALKKTVRKFSL